MLAGVASFGADGAAEQIHTLGGECVAGHATDVVGTKDAVREGLALFLVHQQNAVVIFFHHDQVFRLFFDSRAVWAAPLTKLGCHACLGVVDGAEKRKMEVIAGADAGLARQFIAVTNQFGAVLLEKPGQQAVDQQGAE